MTVIERFVALFRLPYPLTSAMIALLAGPPGAVLAVYLETRDSDYAFAKAAILFIGASLTFPETVLSFGLLVLSLFYVLYGTKFMRSMILKAQPQLVQLLPDELDGYQHAFGRVSSILPPVILTIVLAGVLAGSALFQISGFANGIVTTFYLVVAYPIFFLAVLTFVWVYVSAIRGLYELGRKPLLLRPYYEDRMLGLRPFGSLSLLFALVYFAGLALIAYPVVSSLVTLEVLLGLVGIGIIIFFLPLTAIHRAMLAHKQEEERALLKKARTLLDKSGRPVDGPTIEDTDVSLGAVRDELRRLTAVLALDIDKNHIDSLPSWPFDTSILGRLTAILLSVVAIILSRYVAIFLHVG